MTNLVPGFTWHPIDVAGRAKRRKGRGLIGHVAVSGSTMLVPSGTAANRNADWHFYLPKVGPGFQFIDLDLQCWASMAGNGSCAAFESQGGLGSTAQVNAEPWTPDQIENAARILAHMNQTEGVPLQDMRNSLPGSRGLGVHRYGIDPWRIAGGEMWSNPGKLCPGDAKVRQVPQIVARAIQIVNGDDDMNAAQQKTLDDMAWLVGQMKPIVDVIHNAVIAGDGAGPGNNFAWLYNQEDPKLNAIVDGLGKITPGGTVDPVALAKALLADEAAVAKLGDAIAAGLATRVHNG